MKCEACKSKIAVTQKRVKCSKCNLIYHADCITYGYTSSLDRSHWVCPMCEPSKPNGTPQGSKNKSKSLISSKQENMDTPDRSILKHIDNKLINLKIDLIQTISKNLSESLLLQINEIVHTKISSRINDLISELTEIRNNLEFYSDQYESVKNEMEHQQNKIKNLSRENEQLHERMKIMETKVSYMEQQSRYNNIEIQCVPERKEENVVSIFKNICDTVSEGISEDLIISCKRVAKTNNASKRPRNIIVTLPSPRHRDKILSAVHRYNKVHRDNKLNSHHIGLNGDKEPIFITEHLSPEIKKLNATTRRIAKNKGYKYVWVRYGKIYIRKDENSPSILIRNEDILLNLN